MRFPRHLRRHRLADLACWAMESDPVRIPWGDAEQLARRIEADAGLHPFAHPIQVAWRCGYDVRLDAAGPRGCLGAVLTGRTIHAARRADPRAEGGAIAHELAEGEAPRAAPDCSHGDVWRVHLALSAPPGAITWLQRRRGLTLRALADLQPHAPLWLLRLRLWTLLRLDLRTLPLF